MKPFNRFVMNNSIIALDSLQDHKQSKANGRRLLKKDQDRCLFCNKPMDVTSDTIHVHLTTDGDITSLDDEYQESKIVTEIDLWTDDGSIGICKFLNEAHSPDSDHISNVRILFFETLEEYEQFISDFHKK